VLVVDASVALAAVLSEASFAVLGREELVAPALMWSEARSALHELSWRGEVSASDAAAGRIALENAPVDRRHHPALGGEAWRVADELGWAKTYDAEYLALGLLLDCRVVTLDDRLRRSTARLGVVVSPSEI
jgi:predicted nucleic acid-binding protein